MIQKTPLISQDDILRYVKLSCQMPSAITSIVERRVVEAKAQAVGLKIDATELQKAADSFRLKNNLVTTQETLSWLQRHALSIDDLEALVYDTVLSVKLAEHLFASQVETYFMERWLDYMQVVMYETVLDNSDLAMELFYALQEQEINFTDVVRHYNQDPELRRRGGYRGLVKRKDLTPELSAAVFAATPPQLLKPITKGKKIYLIWIEEVIQPILDDALRSQIVSELFTTWLKQQVAQVDQTKILDPTLIPSITL